MTSASIVGLPLLEALPDETLFSLCSRCHRLWGFGAAACTCLALFGNERAGLQHDFPSALGAFEASTGLAFGSAVALARGRTMLKYYAPFLHPIVIAEGVRSMAGTSIAHLKFRIGLLASGFRAQHPLKACEACLDEDVRTHGWAYWHLDHQFPGVWACPIHGCLLWESTVRTNSAQRFTWHLPRRDQLHRPLSVDRTVAKQVQDLSELITKLVNTVRLPGWLEPQATQVTLAARIRERGIVNERGQLRWVSLIGDFNDRIGPLRALPELAPLYASGNFAKAWVERIALPLRSGTHPLRLLLPIHWLFDHADDFMDAHRVSRRLVGEARLEDDDAIPTGQRSPGRRRRGDVVKRLQRGDSASAVASELRVELGVVMAMELSLAMRRSSLQRP